MENVIRRADKEDISDILLLLEDILNVHNKIRPDIFKECGYKYNSTELENILVDPDAPVFVYEMNGRVVGHAFCKIIKTPESPAKLPRKILFIDDLAVLEKYRGAGIGTALYEHAKKYAKESSCSSVTLHVWNGNETAIRFYEKLGLKPQQFVMEDCFD